MRRYAFGLKRAAAIVLWLMRARRRHGGRRSAGAWSASPRRRRPRRHRLLSRSVCMRGAPLRWDIARSSSCRTLTKAPTTRTRTRGRSRAAPWEQPPRPPRSVTTSRPSRGLQGPTRRRRNRRACRHSPPIIAGGPPSRSRSAPRPVGSLVRGLSRTAESRVIPSSPNAHRETSCTERVAKPIPLASGRSQYPTLPRCASARSTSTQTCPRQASFRSQTENVALVPRVHRVMLSSNSSRASCSDGPIHRTMSGSTIRRSIAGSPARSALEVRHGHRAGVMGTVSSTPPG